MKFLVPCSWNYPHKSSFLNDFNSSHCNELFFDTSANQHLFNIASSLKKNYPWKANNTIVLKQLLEFLEENLSLTPPFLLHVYIHFWKNTNCMKTKQRCFPRSFCVCVFLMRIGCSTTGTNLLHRRNFLPRAIQVRLPQRDRIIPTAHGQYMTGDTPTKPPNRSIKGV